MAADRHSHQPVTVRPSAGPDGDRAWLLAYAQAAGLAEGKSEMAALRAVILLAVAEFRQRHAAEVPGAAS